MKRLTEAERKEVANILGTVGTAGNKLRDLLNLDEEVTDMDLTQAAYLLRATREALERYFATTK